MDIVHGIIAPLATELAAATGETYDLDAAAAALRDISDDAGVTVSAMHPADVEFVIRAFAVRVAA